MASVSVSALKRYLKERSQNEICSDIADLFHKFDAVRDYYQAKMFPLNDGELRKKYKKIIDDEFFPYSGFGKARLSVARKAVSDYRKVSDSVEGAGDLMLYYAETGAQFTAQHGDIDESFYNSMESMYLNAVQWIVKHNLQSQFLERCKKVVEDTKNVGWGFHDYLGDTYAEHFGKFENADVVA